SMKYSGFILTAIALGLSAIGLSGCASRQPVAPVSASPERQIEQANQGPPLSADEIRSQVLEAVNGQRKSSGVQPLTTAPELASSAQAHSEKMMAGEFLSTKGGGEDGATARIMSTGIKTTNLGEDVVRLRTRSDHLAAETVAIWMNVPADRKNL